MFGLANAFLVIWPPLSILPSSHPVNPNAGSVLEREKQF